MIKIHITKESIIYKYRQLGVVERKEPRWQADRMNLPFTRREYGYPFKTINRGQTKRPK